MRLSSLEAFLDPDTFFTDGGELRIGRRQLFGFLDGGCRVRAHSGDIVPEGVQFLFCLTGMTTHHDTVASVIPFEVRLVKARGRVQGLMNIGHKMYQPHKVVGFEIAGAGRGLQRLAEQRNLRLSVWSWWFDKSGVVWREWQINEMPILVLEFISISNIPSGFPS